MTMTRKSWTIALLAGFFAAGLAGEGGAVDLGNSTYVQPLTPPRPPMPRNAGPSGTYVGKGGVLHYETGGAPADRAGRQAGPNTGPSASHIRWCQNRYSSYRLSDDTYQPLAGPRTSCNAPF